MGRAVRINCHDLDVQVEQDSRLLSNLLFRILKAAMLLGVFGLDKPVVSIQESCLQFQAVLAP
jgi:hypothetical protein